MAGNPFMPDDPYVLCLLSLVLAKLSAGWMALLWNVTAMVWLGIFLFDRWERRRGR
jgi:hypothetical protein